MLEKSFFDLLKKHATDFSMIQRIWSEIDNKYSSRGRHYHTLLHLEDLVFQLEQIKNQISDWDTVLLAICYHDVVWDTVLLAICYHDVVYIATKKNNEEKSAELAQKRLSEINFPPDKISKCSEMILATKKHQATGDSDTDHFTDADLSILGQSWDRYSTYFQQIRKEYSIYPDIIYKPARKKVLDHFLRKDRIYKTNYFHQKFESNARQNLQKEKELYT